MIPRLGLVLLLIVGLVACGDSDPAPSGSPEIEPISSTGEAGPPETFEECHADALAKASALSDHAALKPIASALAGSLTDLNPAETGLAGLTASKAPLPLPEAQAIAARAAARADSLEISAKDLAAAATDLEGDGAEAARAASESLRQLAVSLRRDHDAFVAAKVRVANAENLVASDVKMRGGSGAGGKFDTGRLYLGDPSWCEKPAQVDVNAIYQHISEYREIKEKRLKKDGPRYYFLLIEAGKRFRKALAAVARKQGFDVVGGLGAIEFPDREIPDITEEVIAALR